MVRRIDNSRRAGWASAPQRLAATVAGGCGWAWIAVALLAGVGTPAALGQTKNTAHFLPSKTSAGSKAGGARAQYETGLANPAAYYVGSSTVNGTTVQQQVVSFTTTSDSQTFVPTVGLQYGKNYSVGPVSCAQTYDPDNVDPYTQTCTARVTFAPVYPGGHRDALYVFDSDGKTQLTGAFLYGIGLAPQLMIQPGVSTSLQLPSGPYLYGSTTDDTGTFYIYANSNFYTVKGGVATLLVQSVPRALNGLSMDGAGNLFDAGSGGSSGYEYETSDGANSSAELCHTIAGNPDSNPVILPFTTCFYSPSTVAAGNLGTYYEADAGGEATYYSGSTTYSPGLLNQAYNTQGAVVSPGTLLGVNDSYGDLPLPYPISTSYSPSTMVVDAYENLFFGDPYGNNSGITVWCGWGAYWGLSGSSDSCGSSNAMIQLNQTDPVGSMAVDAADTLYVSGGSGVQMFSAANKYGSPETAIGVSGGSDGNAVGPDGTVYANNTSTLNIIDRSQGSINWGSNNGQTSNPQTITIYNGGNQPLTLGTIALTGDSGYTLGTSATNPCSNGLTVATGTVCQIQVTSSPKHAGVLTGAIAIASNTLNRGNSIQEVALTGYTSGIYVTASPNPLSFGFVTPGQKSTVPVALDNESVGSNSVGYGSSTFINSGFTSTNPAFSATAGTCSVVEASGGPNCSINVSFNPSLSQSYSGTISWTEAISGYTNANQKITLAVSGAGTPPIIPFSDLEDMTISDAISLVPSTLLNVNEVLTLSDGMPTTVASTILNLNETLHLSDMDALNGGSFSNATTTVLLPSLTTATAGSTITLSAMVAQVDSSAVVASGAVNFYEDGTLFASPTITNGIASILSPTLTLDSHTFQAIYQGNGTLTASTSSAVTVNVVAQTVLQVTATNASRNFGSANPQFGFAIANTVGGGLPAVTGAPTFTTTATVNSLAGSYPIVVGAGTLAAPAGYVFGLGNGTLTVNGGAAQAITFARLPDIPMSVLLHGITLTAHSSSGLPILYTVTAGQASVSGSRLTISGTGMVTVTASQAGTTTFAPATPVSRSFTVTQ